MTPMEGLYFRSRIIHGDLLIVDGELGGQTGPQGIWFPFVKAALIALANLSDLEGVMRPLFQEHPDLAESNRAISGDLRFAKYLRNVFAGHLNQSLFAKAYIWRPEIRKIPDIREFDGTVMLNVYVLETAINTYVATDGSHGMFPSETDLIYPPDMKRFCEWLSTTVRSGIKLCDDLGAAAHVKVNPLPEGLGMLEAFKEAGLTDFERITKGRA